MTRIWACLLLAAMTPPAMAERSGVDWLMKIHDAAAQLNYMGTFVYVQGGRIATMQVSHRARNGSMRQRIYSLNGAPREVIRDDTQVWCYIPDQKRGVHEYRQVSKQGFPNLLPGHLEKLVDYYDVYTGATGRIADRRAQQLMVVPKDALRYGYELWADQQSGLLLKAALLDESGQPIEQYLFTNVKIGGTITADMLEPVTAKADLVWFGDAISGQTEDPATAAARQFSSNWVIEDIPAGFSLTRQIRRKVPMRSKMVDHFVYSDGLASVSVFIEDLNKDDSEWATGVSKMGAVHAFGREIDGHQVTVVGEVPARTVESIGRSVRAGKP